MTKPYPESTTLCRTLHRYTRCPIPSPISAVTPRRATLNGEHEIRSCKRPGTCRCRPTVHLTIRGEPGLFNTPAARVTTSTCTWRQGRESRRRLGRVRGPSRNRVSSLARRQVGARLVGVGWRWGNTGGTYRCTVLMSLNWGFLRSPVANEPNYLGVQSTVSQNPTGPLPQWQR